MLSHSLHATKQWHLCPESGQSWPLCYSFPVVMYPLHSLVHEKRQACATDTGSIVSQQCRENIKRRKIPLIWWGHKAGLLRLFGCRLPPQGLEKWWLIRMGKIKIQPTPFQVVTMTATTGAIADFGAISFLELSQPQMQHTSSLLPWLMWAIVRCCLSAVLQTTVDHHTHLLLLVLEGADCLVLLPGSKKARKHLELVPSRLRESPCHSARLSRLQQFLLRLFLNPYKLLRSTKFHSLILCGVKSNTALSVIFWKAGDSPVYAIISHTENTLYVWFCCPSEPSQNVLYLFRHKGDRNWILVCLEMQRKMLLVGRK